jgi:hypothetical protein
MGQLRLLRWASGWRKVPEKKIDSRQDVMKSEIDSIDVVINQEYMNI